jgi:hypothetical protein
MERLYSTTEPNDAEMLRLMLEREDISVHLQNTRGSMHATFLPTPATEIDVLVPDERMEEATEVLDDYLDNQPEPGSAESMTTAEDDEWNRLKWLLLFILFGGPPLIMLPFTVPLFMLNMERWAYTVVGVGSLLIILYLLYLAQSGRPEEPTN